MELETLQFLYELVGSLNISVSSEDAETTAASVFKAKAQLEQEIVLKSEPLQ